MTRCDQCGAQTEFPETYFRERRSFRRAIGTWCPRCWNRSHLSIHKWVLLANLLMGGAGLASLWLAPGDPVGWVFLNLSVMAVFIAAIILPHELGHAIAGRVLGFRVFRVYVGAGRTLFHARVLGFDMEFRAIPISGLTLAAPKETRLYRSKRFVFIMAGPLVNLLLAASAWAFIHFDGIESLNWFERGLQPGLAFFYANMLVLVINLWPREIVTPLGKIPSDGQGLWRSLFMKRDAIRESHAALFVTEGAIAHQKRDISQARDWFETGLAQYPESLTLRIWLGVVLIDLTAYGRARELYQGLLALDGIQEPTRALLLNNLAFVDALLGGQELLEEADRCSQEALSKLGWVPAVRGTRGTVLVELGRIEEAIPLLREAMRDAEITSNKAQNACFLSIAEARRGQRAEARKYLEEAKRLDPRCHLLSRAVEAAQ